MAQCNSLFPPDGWRQVTTSCALLRVSEFTSIKSGIKLTFVCVCVFCFSSQLQTYTVCLCVRLSIMVKSVWGPRGRTSPWFLTPDQLTSGCRHSTVSAKPVVLHNTTHTHTQAEGDGDKVECGEM